VVGEQVGGQAERGTDLARRGVAESDGVDDRRRSGSPSAAWTRARASNTGDSSAPIKSILAELVAVIKGYGSGGPVDGDPLPGSQAVGGVAGADDGGDAVLAGDEGGVCGEGTAVGDDRGRAGEQRGPRGGGGFGDEDVSVGEGGEVLMPLSTR
jgi:hypothetical protein